MALILGQLNRLIRNSRPNWKVVLCLAIKMKEPTSRQILAEVTGNALVTDLHMINVNGQVISEVIEIRDAQTDQNPTIELLILKRLVKSKDRSLYSR